MIILLNKPYGVLSQFTDTADRPTLADYLSLDDVYPAGRLDRDSEGLLVLTDDGKLQQQISHPQHRSWKTYWVQVEGVPADAAILQLQQGILLKDGLTLPARARRMQEPGSLWPRNPPIRQRKHIADSWLVISVREGRNRQVRRMTAALGHPTLRLVRVRVSGWSLGQLRPGEWIEG